MQQSILESLETTGTVQTGQQWEALVETGLQVVTVLGKRGDFHYIVGYRDGQGYLIKETVSTLKLVRLRTLAQPSLAVLD